MIMRRVGSVVGVFSLAILALGAMPGGASGASSDSSLSNQVKTAKANFATFQKVPTLASIPAKQPLPSKPPHKKVAILSCEITNCSNVVSGLQAASKSLGWTNQVFEGLTTNPAAGWPQAFAYDPNYIMTFNGLPTNSYGQELAQAKSSNIPVFACYGPDAPTGASGNGIYSQCGTGQIWKTITPMLGSAIIANSNGHANVVHVILKEAGTFGTLDTELKSYLKQNCGGCSMNDLPVTFDQVSAGTVGSAVVTYLQSHPNTTDVLISYSTAWDSVVSALQPTGQLSKLRLETISPDGVNGPFDDIASGEVKGSVVAEPSSAYVSWTETDVAARVSTGASTSAVAQQAEPAYLVASRSAAKKWVAQPWQGPVGYQAYFKKLWKVNS
jgi:hypothetical protein